MEETKRDREEYLDDLREIKKMMTQPEDEGIIEVWVYWVYSVGVLIGSAISYRLSSLGGHSRMNIFFSVWIPLLLICMVVECVGWIRRMDKNNFPLFSRRIVKAFSGFIGLFTVFTIMLGFLLKTDMPHAGIYLIAGAVPLYLYSQISYTSILIEGWILTGTGILFLVNGVNSLEASLISGIIVAVIYSILGIRIFMMERRAHG